MRKLRVMTIVGTRPEIIRLSQVLKAFDSEFDHILVHTGQNYDYELNEIFFRDLGLRQPNHFLNAAGGSATETIANVIRGTDAALETYKPDALLVLGDTNSCLSVIAAKRRKVPTFHMEAGNRCFDMRVPEEINRRIVDHTADVNLTYSSIAREYLLREGLPPDLIIKTGSPMAEVISNNLDAIQRSTIIDTLGVNAENFFVVSLHREENIEPDDAFRRAMGVLNGVAEAHGLPVIVSTHPRTRNRVDATGISLHRGIRLLKPLGFIDYVKLQVSAKVVLSDSGTISEESSILNFPALNLREAHERPEAMEQASVMMTGLSLERVLQGLSILASQKRGEGRTLLPVEDYSDCTVSAKVVRIVTSYTDYVNRVVWKKY